MFSSFAQDVPSHMEVAFGNTGPSTAQWSYAVIPWFHGSTLKMHVLGSTLLGIDFLLRKPTWSHFLERCSSPPLSDVTARQPNIKGVWFVEIRTPRNGCMLGHSDVIIFCIGGKNKTFGNLSEYWPFSMDQLFVVRGNVLKTSWHVSSQMEQVNHFFFLRRFKKCVNPTYLVMAVKDTDGETSVWTGKPCSGLSMLRSGSLM